MRHLTSALCIMIIIIINNQIFGPRMNASLNDFCSFHRSFLLLTHTKTHKHNLALIHFIVLLYFLKTVANSNLSSGRCSSSKERRINSTQNQEDKYKCLGYTRRKPCRCSPVLPLFCWRPVCLAPLATPPASFHCAAVVSSEFAQS